MHFSNGRFSEKETGFSGPYVVWSLLGAPAEKKKTNVPTRKSSYRKQILKIFATILRFFVKVCNILQDVGKYQIFKNIAKYCRMFAELCKIF